MYALSGVLPVWLLVFVRQRRAAAVAAVAAAVVGGWALARFAGKVLRRQLPREHSAVDETDRRIELTVAAMALAAGILRSHRLLAFAARTVTGQASWQ